MHIVGYLLVLTGLFFLYQNAMVIGGLAFFIGGFLAKKLFISIRSAGVMLMLIPAAYGYHNAYSPLIIFLMIIGFIMASFNNKRSKGDDGWGVDIDLSSIFSESGSGDGGGDGGGGGGD